MSAPARSVVDADLPLEALAGWMDREGLGSGSIMDVRPVGGGTQNVMVRFRRGPLEYVLRRGPQHLRAGSNDGMRREMRLLAALAKTDVPHPKLLAASPDGEALDGAAFYVMAPVDGFNPTVERPDAYVEGADWSARSVLTVVDALARLGAVDHRQVGLEGFGRPENFLERQVPRWLGELERFEELDGYPGAQLPGVDAVARWLEHHRPSSFTPGILHGDFHLANVMLHRERPAVAAIVDWEMATIGDPLLDLGWLLATFPGVGAHGVVSSPLTAARDLPGREDLIARYAATSDRDLSAIDWYEVLACFKLGILLEGTHARACAGLAPPETGDRLHRAALSLFRHAEGLISRSAG